MTLDIVATRNKAMALLTNSNTLGGSNDGLSGDDSGCLWLGSIGARNIAGGLTDPSPGASAHAVLVALDVVGSGNKAVGLVAHCNALGGGSDSFPGRDGGCFGIRGIGTGHIASSLADPGAGTSTDAILVALDVVGASRKVVGLVASNDALGVGCDGLPGGDGGCFGICRVGTSHIASNLAAGAPASATTFLVALGEVGAGNQAVALLAYGDALGGGSNSVPGGEGCRFVIGLSGIGTRRVARSLADPGVRASQDAFLVAFHVVGLGTKSSCS